LSAPAQVPDGARPARSRRAMFPAPSGAAMEILAIIVALTTAILIVPGAYLLLCAVTLVEQRQLEADHDQ